jgi:hypothetical protein
VVDQIAVVVEVVGVDVAFGDGQDSEATPAHCFDQVINDDIDCSDRDGLAVCADRGRDSWKKYVGCALDDQAHGFVAVGRDHLVGGDHELDGRVER